MTDPGDLQRAYYATNAGTYDQKHVHPGEGHGRALNYMSGFVAALGLESILDVGSGTGRVVRHLRDRGVYVRGVEPVPELIREGVEHHGVAAGLVVEGSGEALPHPSGSFDAVCAFGVLHHVPQPSKVIDEMMRVARRAIFVSDSNRFGQGRASARVVKLGLYKAGLWPLANWVKTAGRGYSLPEGDGLAYSYSVYDSLDQLSKWTDHVIMIPTEPWSLTSWFHPLLTSGHILTCAFRDAPVSSEA